MADPLTSNPQSNEPRWRYRIQQDMGQYCLKQCDDGDLVDYAEAKAIIERLTAELAKARDDLAVNTHDKLETVQQNKLNAAVS